MNRKERAFVIKVNAYFREHGRQGLPWRKVRDPYRILVSEIMCQQTQVGRVILRYKDFLKKFPTLTSLAHASLGEVIVEWQGLGYNRRAKLLHACAKVVALEHNGKFPKNYEALKKLPGIGPYTAGAIMAFAFNKPVSMIETNIRTVFIHHFFNDANDVLDSDIMQIVERTLDHENPRVWYAALMDYGSHIKQTMGNPNSRSKHYTKQSTFKGSDRQIRGAILRELASQTATRAALSKKLPFDIQRIDEQLERLIKEGMIVKISRSYSLPV